VFHISIWGAYTFHLVGISPPKHPRGKGLRNCCCQPIQIFKRFYPVKVVMLLKSFFDQKCKKNWFRRLELHIIQSLWLRHSNWHSLTRENRVTSIEFSWTKTLTECLLFSCFGNVLHNRDCIRFIQMLLF